MSIRGVATVFDMRNRSWLLESEMVEADIKSRYQRLCRQHPPQSLSYLLETPERAKLLGSRNLPSLYVAKTAISRA